MTRQLHPVPDTPARAIIYVRVSMTGDRAELFSPEMQEHAARDYCTRRGYTVAEVLVDIDRTGRSWSKRQVEQAVQSIERRDADVIVCWRWSRFTRNLRDYVIQTARIETAGGRLEAALEEVDPATAAGLFQRDLFAILAQWESRKIGETWKETHARRQRDGLGHFNLPRLGYRLAGRGYVVDPDTAQTVREMYRRYLAGDGYAAIADWLNSLAVKHPRSGGIWHPKAVRTTMLGGWAAGYLHAGGEYLPGAHEPIVDDAIWRAYLRETTGRRAVAPRLLNPVTPLSGLVKCGSCGMGMRVKRRQDAGHGSVAIYVCQSFTCTARCYVSTRAALAAVMGWLTPLVEDREVSDAARVADSAARTTAKADRQRLLRELTQIETRLTRLTQDLASGLVHTSDYQAARDAFHAERDQLQRALAAVETTTERAAPTRKVIRTLLDGWDETDDLARNRALRELLWKVEISKPQVRGGRSGVRVFGAWERL